MEVSGVKEVMEVSNLDLTSITPFTSIITHCLAMTR